MKKRYELLRKGEDVVSAAAAGTDGGDAAGAAAAAGSEDVSATKEFDNALAGLTDTLKKAGGAAAEAPPKKKKKEELEEGMEYDENGKPVKKKEAAKKSSLIDELAEGDPEATAAMDVEPFLKSLVEKLSTKLEEVTGELAEMKKSLGDISEVQEAQSTVILAEGEMLKSALNTDDASQQAPVSRKSVLTLERFTKSGEGAGKDNEDLTVATAKVYLLEMAKSKVLTPMQVGVVEGRLNKSLPLPDYFLAQLKKINAGKEA